MNDIQVGNKRERFQLVCARRNQKPVQRAHKPMFTPATIPSVSNEVWLARDSIPFSVLFPEQTDATVLTTNRI
jgi:hypothetical protein